MAPRVDNVYIVHVEITLYKQSFNVTGGILALQITTGLTTINLKKLSLEGKMCLYKWEFAVATGY